MGTAGTAPSRSLAAIGRVPERKGRSRAKRTTEACRTRHNNRVPRPHLRRRRASCDGVDPKLAPGPSKTIPSKQPRSSHLTNPRAGRPRATGVRRRTTWTKKATRSTSPLPSNSLNGSDIDRRIQRTQRAGTVAVTGQPRNGARRQAATPGKFRASWTPASVYNGEGTQEAAAFPNLERG